MGLIATRSITEPVTGIKKLVSQYEARVRNGAQAYALLERLCTAFDAHKQDLGYGLLLKKYVNDPATTTPEQVRQAARDTITGVASLF